VEDREDIEELVDLFYDSPHALTPQATANEVVDLVRAFVAKRTAHASRMPAPRFLNQSQSAAMTEAEGEGSAKTRSILSEKKARKKEQERRFWKTLGHVISDETLSVWDALDRGLRRYNTLLEERSNLIDETTELARQNEELKILLQEYLGSKINQELYLPPTRLMQ